MEPDTGDDAVAYQAYRPGGRPPPPSSPFPYPGSETVVDQPVQAIGEKGAQRAEGNKEDQQHNADEQRQRQHLC